MRIALIQLSVTPGAVAANTAKMLDLIAAAERQGADVVVFPELSDTGYDLKQVVAVAQRWEQGTVPELATAARVRGLNIVAGVSERTDQGVFNSLVVINREGQVAARYRKTHLITAEPIFEHLFLKAGDVLVTTVIDGVPCGLMTCYDVRFPEIARTLSVEGAHIIFVPSAFPLVRLQHWRTLVTARAIENQLFVVAANRVGSDANVPFCGTSMILDPYGVTLASGSEMHESVVIADLDMTMIETVRTQIKVHQDRRPELYKLA